MDRKIWRIVGIVAVAVILAIGYLVFKEDKEPLPTQTAQQSSSPDTAPAQANNKTGAYVDYSETVIAETSGQKVLFFFAPWCPQCRSIEAGIKKDGVPGNLTIIKVDYDSNQALRQKYGVTLQTTFVKIQDNGDFISRYVAYDEPTFAAVKENYL